MHRDSGIHRCVAWLLLMGYGLVASGLPLPLGAVAPGGASPAAQKRLTAKDRSTPFPCMDKPCGCATAEQCFTQCCCNTPAETLAWAKAHTVDPAVIAALQRRAATTDDTTAEAPSCCFAKTQASCCSAATARSCCADDATSVATGDEPLPAEQPADESSSRHTVVLKAMLACGGIVSQWLSIGGAPPPMAVVAVASITPLVEAILPGDDVVSCVRAAPDAPPPRVT
ncbi:MAG: hypothetical protein ACKOEX_00785 [Planctomycetia bacterium]